MAKGPSYTDVLSALRGQYAVLVAGLSGRDPQGPTDCAGWTLEHLETQVELLEAAFAGAAEDKVVEQRTGRHTLKDAAVFRLVEAVVHGLDAGIAPHPGALKIVVKELARALADRHPGKSVEVRIPPYAAVQCLEGPRHTRGTPPNVVEADPVAWVRVCAGRESWADLIRTGCITASGERSDLTSVFPLLS